MRRSISIAIALGLFGLAACTAGKLNISKVDSALATSEAVVAAMCPIFAPLAENVIAHNNGAAKVSAQFGAGLCAADGTVVPGVKIDASTGAWIAAITSTVTAADAALKAGTKA